MEEALVKRKQTLMTNQEAAEVTQVGKGALDFPALGIATQGAPIVAGASAASPAMRADQDNAALEQAPAQWVTIVSAIGNDAQRSALGSSPPGTRHRDARQSRFRQG